MTAHAHLTHTRARSRSAGHPGNTRLPWWALALPAAVFCTLLALLLAGGEANAAGQGGEQPTRLLERLQQSLL